MMDPNWVVGLAEHRDDLAANVRRLESEADRLTSENLQLRKECEHYRAALIASELRHTRDMAEHADEAERVRIVFGVPDVPHVVCEGDFE